MGRTEYINRISYQLSVLAARVKANSQNGRTDINVDSEMTVCGLVNRLMGWELKTLNDRKANFPGIDLADRDRRIAVQVTATATGHKINHTLDEFLNNGFDRSFDRLVTVIITTDKLPSATAKERGNFFFDPVADVWNINTLTGFVKKEEDIGKLEEIACYLEKELESPAPNSGGIKRGAGKMMWCAGLLALVMAVAVIWGVFREPHPSKPNVEGTEDLLMWDAVTELLQKEKLTKTAIPLSVYESGLHGGDRSYKTRSVSYPLALYCANIGDDPIEAFHVVRKEWFTPRQLGAELFVLPLMNGVYDEESPYMWWDFLSRIPDEKTEGWEWSAEGVTAFLSEMLSVAAKCEDLFDVDDRFLTAVYRSEEPVVHYSAGDQCYYTCFIYYGDYNS